MSTVSIRQRINQMIGIMLYMAIGLLVLIISVVFIFKNKSFDQVAFDFTGRYRSPGLTAFMRGVSLLGNHLFLIPANLVLLSVFLILKERWWAIRIAVMSLSSLLLMSLLKNLFQRVRPDHPMVLGITNFGFPSGHGMMAVVFYGLIAGWIAVAVNNKWLRRGLIAFLVMLIIVIGYSRVYLRVHYATDVLAGFCVGTIWMAICLAAVQAFRARQTRKRN